MEKERIDRRYLRLGRAMYGAYHVHSEGKTWNGASVLTWSELMQLEHDRAGTPRSDRAEPLAHGTIAHWRFVAITVTTSPEHADALARSIEERLGENEVYQTVTS